MRIFKGNFGVKATRYLSAMRRCPQARLAELAPIAQLLPQGREMLVDLLGGSGFVSEFLGRHFRRTSLLDATDKMLPQPSVDREVIKGNGLDGELLQPLSGKCDMAVCLAAFHHIPPDERELALQLWSQTLTTGGRLAIADVAVPFSAITHSAFSVAEKAFLTEAGSSYEQAASTFDLSSFRDARDPEPALFFDDFVRQESPLGHEGVYESRNHLCNLLVNSGFSGVNWQLRFTPWIFSDIITAAWFIHELFAIGDSACESPHDLSEQEVNLITTAIERHLGYRILPDGRCVVFWKLFFAWGDKYE